MQRQAEIHFDNILKPIYWLATPKRYGSFPATSRLVFGGNSPVTPLEMTLVFLVGLGWVFLHIGSLVWSALQTGRCRPLLRESTQGVEETKERLVIALSLATLSSCALEQKG